MKSKPLSATALAAAAASINAAVANPARFAINARKLAATNRIPPHHAQTMYGAKPK